MIFWCKLVLILNPHSTDIKDLRTTCYSQINVTPKQVDFGEIDICIVSEAKKIQITNTGTKQGQFSIDLGRNLLQLIVEPMKGTLQVLKSLQLYHLNQTPKSAR